MKTFIQSQQWSGCNAEEISCERVGLAGGVDLFSIHGAPALSRLPPWGAAYQPGRSRGLFECHAGWHRVLRTLTFERYSEQHPVPSREDTVTRAAGKRELRVGAYAPPRLEPAPQARYGAKTSIQSHLYSGRSADETSCEHVGFVTGLICFLLTAYRRWRACLRRARPNYWPGRGRGLFECHAGWQRVRTAATCLSAMPVDSRVFSFHILHIKI